MEDRDHISENRIKVLFISLGCDKNRADSEDMTALLRARGYELTDDESEAECAVINTCCFIKDALIESIDTIFEISQLKKTAKLRFLVIAGCMSERYKEEIEKEIPEADAFIGTSAIDKITDALDGLISGRGERRFFCDLSRLPLIKGKPTPFFRPYMAYLKIAEGCDKRCTYCAIPNFRGPYRSVPMQALIEKAEMYAESGVKELILVAQETTCYGVDLYGEKRLHTLIKKLSEIDDIKWIRIMYCYPEEIYPELIREIKTNPKALHYLDIPLQHTSSDILRRMGRRLGRGEAFDIISGLRKEIPDICLRTTIIAGFPGETVKDHEMLLEDISALSFDRLGCFTYSPEEGTPAADFEGQLDEALKDEYLEDIMELQQEISYDINASLIGSIMEVMIEGYIPQDDVYAARSYRDAPDVDGMIFIKSDHEMMSGSFVKVRVTGASEYDLTAEIFDE